MKKVIISATKLRMFLCVIPLVFLLVVCIINNEAITTPGKLYPLIIATIAGIIAMILYLLRGVRITAEEIRSIGLFSSKDSAVIKKDRTLSITLRPKGKLRVELYGRDDAPGLDWLKATEKGEFDEVNLYRDIAVGSDKTVGRVLGILSLDRSDISEILKSDKFDREYPDFRITKRDDPLGKRYDVRFYTTL